MDQRYEHIGRALELLGLAAEHGITLPMDVDQIVALEAQGHIVDFDTGEITKDGADLYVEPGAGLLEGE